MNAQPSSPSDVTARVRLDPENPWPGLVPYAEEHAAFFFGRDNEAEELFRRVARKMLTLLFGQSGLGKSSLLNAALYPKLRKAGYLPVDLRLDFRASEPLESQAVRQITSAVQTELVDVPLSRSGESLWFWLHRHDVAFRRSDGNTIIPVFVFDQFEEFFTIGNETDQARALAETFLRELADLVENRTPPALDSVLEHNPEKGRELVFGRQDYRVLISMREEYVANLDSLAPTMRSVGENRMRLLQMNGVQALQAVNGPGTEIVTPAVGRKIVRFVAATRRGALNSGDGSSRGRWEDFEPLQVEPSLLSLVCRELNRRRQQRGLSQITEELLSGSGALESILREFYENCVGDQPLAVRAFVEDELLTESGFRETIAFERAERMLAQRGVDPSAINLLVNRRLLRFEERLEIRRVELVHDVLANIVKSSGEERRSREAVERAEKARDEEAERRRIAEAESQAALRDKRRFHRISMLAMAFAGFAMVGALVSVFALARANQERKHAERAKIAAQLSQEGAAKSAQEALNQREDALNQRKAAEEAKLRAQSLKAAWRCVNMAPEKLDLALLLSAEAVRRSGGQEAKNALLTSLLASSHLDSFLRGHSSETTVASLVFSPDGRTLASADGTGTIILWDPDSGLMVREPIQAHKEYIYSIAFSPDGRQLASASKDKTVKLVDIASGRVEKLGEDADFDFRGVAFSSDSKVLAAACGDGSVRRWNIANKAPIASLVHHDRRATPKDVQVETVTFSPDGKLLVSAGDDDHLVLWDVEKATKKQTANLKYEERPVFQVAFSPDGKWIATGSAKGAVTLWNAKKLDRTYGPALEHDRGIYGLEFSPDGKTLASARADQSARLWDVAAMTAHTGEPSKSLEGYSEGVYSIAFRPFYTDMLATGHKDGTVTLWNLSDQPRIARPIEAISGEVNALAFGAGGKLLVSAQGKSIVVWDAGKGKWQTDALQGHRWPVTSVAVSPRGSLIASASQDMTIRLWDSASGRQLGASLKGHAASVNTVAFSPRGDLLASASDDKTIRLWKIGAQRFDGIDAQLVAELTGHTDAVLCVAFSPDGNTLASGGSDKTVRLWDVQSGRQVGQPLAKHEAAVFRIAFHPDGKRLATGDRDGSIILWDRVTSRPLPTKFAGYHGASVIGLEFNPNGKTLLSAGYHSKVMSWSLDTGKAIGEPLTGLGSEVTSLAVGPNGSVIAAGSTDAINVLELTGAEPVGHVLQDGLEGIWSLAISHDGATLAGGGNTGNIICWDTRTNRQKGIPLRTDATGVNRLFFSPDDRLLGAVSEQRIVFWNVATGEEAGRLVEESEITDAAFDRAGARLATGTASGAINLWDWPSLKRRGERLKSHTDRVRSLAFSPDGECLYSCGDDGTSMQHDLSTAPPTSMPLEGYDVMRMAWSPDGKTFVCGGADGAIAIYDASLHRSGTLKHHKAPIIHLAFSPDGKVLASTSWSHLVGQTITLFDVNTRQPIGPPLSGHKADVSGLVFGNDGKTMFSADEEGVIFRWDVNVDSWQTLAASIAGRGLTKEEALEYLGEASPPPLSDPATLLKRADAAALKKAPDARALFCEAVKAAITNKDPEVCNDVCWIGSVDRFADVVLPAGDREVEVADEHSKAFYRDTRGLARALAGKKQEAIEDFRAFIAWAESHELYEDNVSMRKEWIKEMEDNKDPFTDETLRRLRGESYGFDLD